MGAKKFRRRLRGYTKVAADGTGYVRSERIERNQTIACQSIAFRNRTGTRGTVTLSVEHAGTTFPFADQSAPTVNRWWFYPYTQYIGTGERVEASQASCKADDELDLVVIGYMMYAEEREVA